MVASVKTGSAAIKETGTRQQVNILVVDDLPEKHVVFRTILDELDQNIVSARSGQEALGCILEMEFAVILLDVNMPDIDGLETAGLIRQYRKSAQTPIVFITAYVDEIQARRGYALGAVDYIPSPVVPDVLRSKVRVFVELFRMNRQLREQAAAREALAWSEAARAAAEEAIHRADYLAEASQVLSRSLDLDDTIKALFEVAIPFLGERAVLALAGPEADIKRIESWPAQCGGDVGAEPLRDCLRVALRDRRFELLREGEQATAVCPLLAGDSVLGALVLVGGHAQFDSARLALIKEVVSRASIAMENAKLYHAVQEADRRKNEFLAMLAHELRNPLAPIRNAVYIMQGEDVPPARMNWARDVIGRQADHMARLIDDLLDVSRIVQGKVVVQVGRLQLSTLVERAVEATAPRVAAQGQTLVVELPAQDVVLHGDLVRLSQVLSNLINNASKFSGAGTRIQLQAQFVEGKARISVRDEGAGIEPAFLPHIFDLFVQGDQTLDRSQGGLGIGLTLVKQLVELHGGRVAATSAGPGHGTEVTVWLPAQEVAVQPTPVPAALTNQARPTRAPARILVVDDLVVSAETLMTLLEMEGFDVRIASEGETALRIAQEFKPDVVLLDIGLPGMNGFEVANRLRDMPYCREALLIALTGYGEAESRSRSGQAGFDFHMVKPADVNLLLSMLADPQQTRRDQARTP
ncbi:MAG: response regulator [Ramlibacter sp.]|nr:response regulator [Ramlibacter sp.]